MISETQFAPPVLDEPAALKAYFAQVASYQSNEARSARRSARVAWLVASGAGAIAFTACLAVAGLTPLKTISPPVVFRVNDVTGQVDQIHDVISSEMSVNEAQRRYFLWRFVRAWHGYSDAEAPKNLEAVSLMSTAAVQSQYAEDVRPTNPKSPYARLGKTGRAVLEWVSLKFDARDPKQATIRFRLTEYRGDQVMPVKLMESLVAFDFAPGSLTDSQINVNPNGMIVTHYRADPEAVQ